MPRGFTFPGQGSQYVGMGAALADAFPVARELLEEVDDALDMRLARLMAEGPESDLRLTENAQPALMAASLAVVRVIEKEGGAGIERLCAFVSGHSLGEYAALAAAGSLGIADAARLLRLRGRAMQRAVPVGEGAMAALLGAELETAETVAREAADGQVCEVANDNATGQVVISGHTAAVERAIDLAKEKGVRRGVMLPVSAPFHCSLLAPAADAMAEALASVEVRAPKVPLVANVTAEKATDPDVIRDLLVRQVTARVRWRESVLYMKSCGVDTLIEAGAGKVLTGLVRRIDADLAALSVEGPADVETFLKGL
ncbi:MAG: ACP S-malonyltransferase [Acetobacterales bacterium]